MPKVVKQTTKKVPRKKNGGIISEIRPIGKDEDGIKLSVYGRGKTGKTRLACTFPKPLLLIGTEKGTKSVQGVKGVDFVRIRESGHVDELVDLLKGGKYQSAVLDTAGGLSDLCLKEVLGLDELPVQRTWGMAQQRDWQVMGAQVKERLRQLLDLSETHGLHTVIIAHERSFNDDNDNDLIFPMVGSALSPSVAGWLNGACDYICQTFIREETTTKTVKLAGKAKTMTAKTGRSEYCLRVGAHSVFMTGFRIPRESEEKLPEGRLPEWISDPSYEKIAGLIEGELL